MQSSPFPSSNANRPVFSVGSTTRRGPGAGNRSSVVNRRSSPINPDARDFLILHAIRDWFQHVARMMRRTMTCVTALVYAHPGILGSILCSNLANLCSVGKRTRIAADSYTWRCISAVEHGVLDRASVSRIAVVRRDTGSVRCRLLLSWLT